MTMAISVQHTDKPATRILEFLRVTGNSHTARELGHVLGIPLDIVRRRMTDLSNLVNVRASVRGPTRGERVYRIR